MGKYGTVEFRQYKSTTNAKEIIWWGEKLLQIARFALAMEEERLAECCGSGVQLYDLFPPL